MSGKTGRRVNMFRDYGGAQEHGASTPRRTSIAPDNKARALNLYHFPGSKAAPLVEDADNKDGRCYLLPDTRSCARTCRGHAGRRQRASQCEKNRESRGIATYSNCARYPLRFTAAGSAQGNGARKKGRTTADAYLEPMQLHVLVRLCEACEHEVVRVLEEALRGGGRGGV